MATNSQNSKHIVHDTVPSAEGLRFALIVSRWNSEITDCLFEGAHQILKQQQAKQIVRIDVPGSFELIYGAKLAQGKNPDAVIVLKKDHVVGGDKELAQRIFAEGFDSV